MSHYKLKPSFIPNSIVFYRIPFLALEILPQTYFAVPNIWEHERNSDAFVRLENASNHLPAKLQFAMGQPDIYFILYLS